MRFNPRSAPEELAPTDRGSPGGPVSQTLNESTALEPGETSQFVRTSTKGGVLCGKKLTSTELFNKVSMALSGSKFRLRSTKENGVRLLLSGATFVSRFCCR